MEAGHHGWLDPPKYPELNYTGVYYRGGPPWMVGYSEVNFSFAFPPPLAWQPWNLNPVTSQLANMTTAFFHASLLRFFTQDF
jgi:hypothetical protein